MASSVGAPTVVVELDEFEERFLPAPPTLHPRTQSLATGIVSHLQTSLSGTSESRLNRKEKIGTILLSAISNYNLAEGHRSRGYHYASETGSSDDDAAIGMLYPKEYAPSARTEREDWSRVQMIIQFESGGARYDPYDENGARPDDPLRSARAAARDHLLSCATSIFEYQHRVFLFGLYINDRHIRAMRLDHSGIMTTKPVDYIKDPSVLPRLLWRFAHLTDAQKGADTTATRLDERSDDYKLMSELGKADVELDIDYEEGASLPPFHDTSRTGTSRAAPAKTAPQPPTLIPSQSRATADPRVFKHVRKMFSNSLCRSWPRYRLKVGEEGREFLVAMPAMISSSALFGRGCRAYVAVDCLTRQFVWLKDSWRPRSECSRPEGTVLAAFAGDSKLHVPTLVCHGYVRQQSAPESARPVLCVTQEPMTPMKMKTRSAGQEDARVIGMKRSREDDCEEELQPSPKKMSRRTLQSLPAYGHYRVAVKEIGLDLENFASGWQLVRLIFECVRTHARAYKEYGLLHGDISPGNILINPVATWKDGKEVIVWHGMLIDWELAQCVRDNKLTKVGGDDVPILSWEYAAMNRVSNPRSMTTVEDELEAFFYVLLWYAIRYMRHTLPSKAVTPFITEFYDTFKRYPNGGFTCNDLRAKTITDARLHYGDTTEILFCDDGNAPAHPLNGLLFEFLRRFQARYAVMQWNKSPNGVPGTTQHPQKVADTTTAGRPVLRETHNLASRRLPVATLTTRNTREPSAKTHELARSLQSHKGVVVLFADWVLKNGWPLHDKVRDRLSKSYVYTRRFVDVPAVALASVEELHRKRAKLVENGEEASR